MWRYRTGMVCVSGASCKWCREGCLDEHLNLQQLGKELRLGGRSISIPKAILGSYFPHGHVTSLRGQQVDSSWTSHHNPVSVQGITFPQLPRGPHLADFARLGSGLRLRSLLCDRSTPRALWAAKTGYAPSFGEFPAAREWILVSSRAFEVAILSLDVSPSSSADVFYCSRNARENARRDLLWYKYNRGTPPSTDIIQLPTPHYILTFPHTLNRSSHPSTPSSTSAPTACSRTRAFPAFD